MQIALSDQTIRRRFPYPIAAAWHRVALAENDDERIRRLFSCNEVLLRTLASLLLPDYLRGPAAPAVEGVFARFRKNQPATDGIWHGLVRDLIRAIGERSAPAPFMPEAYPWFFRSRSEHTETATVLENFLTLRNTVIHKGITPAETRERAATLHWMLRSVLLDMGWLPGYRPFRVASIETTRSGTFTGKVQFLVGREEQNEFTHGEWAPHLVKQGVYLTNPTGTALLDLVPFAEFRDDHLYLLKSIDALHWVMLVHDASGSEIRREVESEDGDIAFDEWMARRTNPEHPKRPKHDAYLSVGTNSSIFRLASQGMTVDADLALGPRFEKLEELGQGGMAVVFRVLDRDHERKEYALKVLKSDLAEDDMCRKRFWREAKSMGRVRHPRIMSMLESAELPSGQPWLKMPVMAKGSLQDQIIANTPRPETLVRRWAQEALEALQCIHKADIVHRDIKPSNFLVDDNDHVMLTDFGIALGSNDERWTQTLRPLATLAYMAPEQATGDEITEKADIYSLAIVLHELLTGSHPKGPPGKGLRRPFGDLIRRMGSSDPEKRPTATQALEELRKMPAVRNPTGGFKPEKTPKGTTADSVAYRTPAEIRQSDEAAVATALRQMEEEEKRRDEELRIAEIARLAELKELEELKARQELKRAEEQKRLEEETGQRELQRAVTVRRQRVLAIGIFAALFLVNWLETTIETALRTGSSTVLAQEQSMAEAAMWFERGLTFENQDALGAFAQKAFTTVYFGVFPLLLLLTAVTFARRRDSEPLLLFAMATAVDYAITLPFYLFFPVPERWSYPDANAILLSDLVNTQLIEWFRPFSGLNNCFPSFHVSLSIIAVLCLYYARAPFRTATIPLAGAVILSTFALGIHWTADIIAGLAAGIISIWLAARIIKRMPQAVLLDRP